MRLSQYPINTVKETPSEAEVISHQLMLRAGMIRRVAAGIYSWLPLGLRTLRKVEAIVREEMNRAGALELLMPAVQPAELWQESGRWNEYGPELLRLKDRHERDFVIGPTHEEVITDIARRELKSYRQLPVNFYQIQTKFRDEVRPRFGVMRGARVHHEGRLFLPCRRGLAGGGLRRNARRLHAHVHAHGAEFPRRAGRHRRHRRQRLGGIPGAGRFGRGRHRHLRCRRFRGQRRARPGAAAAGAAPAAGRAAERMPTPGAHTIEQLSALLKLPPSRCLKTLIVTGSEGAPVALLLRGDHDLNAVKAQKLPGIASPLRMASAAAVQAATGCAPGSIGPLGLSGLRVYADHAALAMADFVCGANEEDVHFTGVNWGRDLPEAPAADLRNVVAGDPSPSGNGRLQIVRGIEVGHIFQLGRKYSAAMNATVLDEAGAAVPMLMGCYGIGVTRIVAAAIEQNHDERGIIWPEPIAPFQVVLVPLNLQKSPRVRSAADALYAELCAAGIDVLYDDRDARPGVKFADAELLGIPHRVVIGERGLDAGTLEYRHRRATDSEDFPQHAALEFIRSRLQPAQLGANAHRSRGPAVAARLRAARAALPRPGPPAHAPAQRDPELREVVQQAISQAQCFADQYDSAVWYTLMEPKLRRYVKDDKERLEILQTVYCEAHRSGASVLPPGLIMAVLDVESGFDRWAVSSAGAVGLMQVMPFWPEQLGMRRYELTRITANLHMGCAILRFYLDSERRDVRRALERYNGSIGRRDYPDRVIVRWTRYWHGADDLGTRTGQAVLKSGGSCAGWISMISTLTAVTLAADGPIHSHSMNSRTARSSPQASTSTRPSSRLRAWPAMPAARARCWALAR